MISTLPVIEETEIVVVGAGPAGSTCAAKLADLGHEVVLVDQDDFPREKPCGDGVTRSAIHVLEQLGLSELIESGQQIEGARMVLGYAVDYFKPFEKEPGRARYARCIPRHVLDQALLGAATTRGACFLKGRAEGLIGDPGEPKSLEVRQNGSCGQIKARHIIAADGATSRLRNASAFEGRRAGTASGVASYAVRQYFRTEKALDPVYEIFGPMQYQGRAIAGYGWIFPNGEHEANVGIGFVRGAGLGETPSLRSLLESFVDELRQHRGDQLGEIESTGKPFGSPLGTNFSADRCQVDNVTFVGDAARMTDPLSGEGIAKAMNGAGYVATAVHEELRGSKPKKPIGQVLAHRYPRLSQDLALYLRLGLRLVNSGSNVLDGVEQPFLETTYRLIRTREQEPSLAGTPVWAAMQGEGYDCRKDLEAVNDSLLATLQSDFPFTTELLHREIRSAGGPLYAATLLLSAQACAGRISKTSRRAAAALELLFLGPNAVSQISERPSSEMGSINNTLCVLTTDFACTRAFQLASQVAADTTAALARAMQRACEGEMLEIEDEWNVNRSRERYFEAIDRNTASLFAFAAELGAGFARRPELASTLADYGRAVGTAHRISTDVLDLVCGDDVTQQGAGAELAHGRYSLPAIYAIQFEPQIRELLASPAEDPATVGVAIENAGGIAAAVEECKSFVATATATAAELPDAMGAPLEALANMALARLEPMENDEDETNLETVAATG